MIKNVHVKGVVVKVSLRANKEKGGLIAHDVMHSASEQSVTFRY